MPKTTTDILVEHVVAGRLLMSDVLDDLRWLEQHRPDRAAPWRDAARRLKETGHAEDD